MSVHKRQYRSRKTIWYYVFNAPGSTRSNRTKISASGFATKREAQVAEAARRAKAQEEFERADGAVAAPAPRTLAQLLEEFFDQHAVPNLAPKTIERYREMATYLDAGLLAMQMGTIRPLHLNREWKRLRESGGHRRGANEPRPLSKKTVRGIAGVVSSAFSWAIAQEIIAYNPVRASKPPVPAKPRGEGLAVAQLDLLIAGAGAGGPWCLPLILEMTLGLGARRGEVLALRRTDIVDGRAYISRSLSQTFREVEGADGKMIRIHDVLEFKPLKGHEDREGVRVVKIPDETLAKLEAHLKRQDEFRRQFGPDYRSDLDLIFCNPDGTPFRPDSISATVSALFRRLKIPKPKGASLHLLRHAMASQMLAAGAPLPAVSARLGHSSIRTTAEIYSHAIHGQDDEATRKWEEYRQRNRPAKSEGGGKDRVQ